MADGTHIQWTDATWNPVTGCSVVSPGCTNCYAMRLAGTRLQHHPSRKGLTRDSKAGPVWTGETRFNEDWLDQPLRWRRPRRIFVCAHGDLFAEGVPDEWIDRVFAVMALAPQHTFQVLTKRAQRMREYSRRKSQFPIVEALVRLVDHPDPDRDTSVKFLATKRVSKWPLPNVWLGVSAEDQARADERIQLLLDTPAAKHFVSLEPLLGPIDLRNLRAGTYDAITGVGDFERLEDWGSSAQPRLSWCIVGGESGPGARPMDSVWARALRDQCQAAGVAFHFKQWGQWHPDALRYKTLDGISPPPNMKIGKKKSGRLLDGREWNEFPA